MGAAQKISSNQTSGLTTDAKSKSKYRIVYKVKCIEMIKLAYVLRVLALAILFGGSISVVISAITLVKAAEAHGVPVAQAATANAPMFITFSNIVMVSGFVLLFAESMDYAKHRVINKLLSIRYGASLLCSIATIILCFAIVPPMKEMLSSIHENERTEQTWKTFHESSRVAFGVIILSALISLVMPVFEMPRKPVD